MYQRETDSVYSRPSYWWKLHILAGSGIFALCQICGQLFTRVFVENDVTLPLSLSCIQSKTFGRPWKDICMTITGKRNQMISWKWGSSSACKKSIWAWYSKWLPNLVLVIVSFKSLNFKLLLPFYCIKKPFLGVELSDPENRAKFFVITCYQKLTKFLSSVEIHTITSTT